MSAKHTPGPWVVFEDDYERHVLGPMTGRAWMDNCVATVRDGANIDANAHLIAAAPELLEALKSFPGFTDDATVGDPWIEKIRAAIAKAEGKP